MNKINNSKKSPEVRFSGFTDDWEHRKLREIAKFNPKEKLPDRFEYVDLESVVGTRMISHRTELKDDAPSRAQRLAQRGDVFFQTVRPYQKNNYLYDLPYENYVFSTGYAQMRPNIDSYFLLTSIQKDQFVKLVLDRSTGTSYPAINSKDLSNIGLSIPNNSLEQKKIGSFFKQLDDTITLHQRKLDLLKEQKKGFLQKMFPKNGEKVPEIRFPGFPDDWEHRKLGDMLDLLKDGSHGTHKDVTEGIYLLSAKNIKNSQIVIDESTDRKISEDEYNSIHKNFSLQKDDVLLTIVGSIGESAILRNPNNITFQRSVAYLRPNRDLQAQFLLTTINGPIFQSELKKRQVVSAQPGIYLGDLALIPIQIPSVTEQQKVGALFKQLNDTITLHQRKLELLKEIKKAFLKKMFV